jgi:hypothetical protein
VAGADAVLHGLDPALGIAAAICGRRPGLPVVAGQRRRADGSLEPVPDGCTPLAFPCSVGGGRSTRYGGRSLPQRGQVETLVELTFGNGAVTEETRRDPLVAAHLVGRGAAAPQRAAVLIRKAFRSSAARQIKQPHEERVCHSRRVAGRLQTLAVQGRPRRSVTRIHPG